MNLYDHQKTAVAWLYQNRKALIADAQGLGKTLVALALAVLLSKTGEWAGNGARVLIVTRANLIPQWEREATTHTPELTVGTSADKKWKGNRKANDAWNEAHPNGPDLLILSYEFALNRLHELRRCQPSLIVLDEVSSLKGAGKQYEAVRALTRLSSRVVGLTATPVENAPMEGFTVLDAIGVPGLCSRQEFSNRYVIWKEGYNHPRTGQWIEATDVAFRTDTLPELQQLTATVALRRTAEGAQIPLPERVGTTERFYPLTEAQEAAYEAAEGHYDPLAKHHAQERAGRITDGQSGALDMLAEELSSRPDKCIVYCETLDFLTAAEQRLTADGIGYARIDGSTPMTDRDGLVEQFRDDPNTRILLASNVIEYGMNLQFCNWIISVDTSWNPARQIQREMRVRRIGSRHDTYTHTVLLPDTPKVRRDKAQALERKGGLLELFLPETPIPPV